MKKSDDVEIWRTCRNSIIPTSEEIEEAITRKPYIVDKRAKLTWDGRQFIIRIPWRLPKR
jgi:hypothetical protein